MHDRGHKADKIEESQVPELPLLSVVVPFKKTECAVLECLRSIFSMDYPPEKLEVLAVDDGYDDDIAELIRNDFPLARLIRYKRSLGCDGAKQSGIDAATGDIISVTDADCVVHSRWAREIAKSLSSGADVVTGPVRHPKTFLRELIGVSDFQDYQSNHHRWIDGFPGCNVAARSEIFRVHGYRVESDMKFGSDRILSWQMYSQGLKILYNPMLIITHKPAVDTGSLLERRIRYGRKTMALRRIDPTLPGSAIIQIGLLAAPAYVFYRLGKDAVRLSGMVRYNHVNILHAPLIMLGLVGFRVMDSIGIITAKRHPC